ncbi:META domain-containing protein [Streptomyces sp. NPDC059009]|uniref:META domain-containing protein n=1 Tax=Streptomyces sp. NPDC059009 TaxID=3346694 RepID=UPI003698E595
MQKHRVTPALTALAAAGLLLTACGTQSGSGGADRSDDRGGRSVDTELPLTGVHWNVDSVTVGKTTHDAPAGAFVEFTDKGQAEGNYGCNSMGADVKIHGDAIDFSQTRMTDMGCDKVPMRFEETLSKALGVQSRIKAKVDGDRLTLTTAKGDRVRLSSEPGSPLVGTKWTVTAVGDGRTATSLPKGVTGKVELTFGKDGKARGNLGCNGVTATAKPRDGRIALGPPATTRKMCPGPAMQTERKLLKLFGGTARYELKHRSLTLTAKDGTVVSASAAPSGQHRK